MANHRALQDSNPSNSIMRFSRQVQAGQYIRELVQNSIEAGATSVEIFPYSKGAIGTRMCIADNGTGMSASDMVKYLGSYNSSSKSISSGLHDNFGIGVKATCAVANPYGIVFVSWQNGIGNLLWFSQDTITGQFGIRSIPYPSAAGDEPLYMPSAASLSDIIEYYPDGFEGVKWQDVEAECKRITGGTGTLVMLCGASQRANSYVSLTDATKATVRREYTQFLNTRYWSIPKGVTLRVKSQDNQNFTINGYRKLMEEPGFTKATEELTAPDGSKIAVCITEQSTYYENNIVGTKAALSNKGYSTDGMPNGIFAVLYKNEMYFEPNGVHAGSRWGINIREALQHVKIFIRPPIATDTAAGIFPNDTRDKLYWRSLSGETTPYSPRFIQRWFLDNIPEILSKLLAELQTKQQPTVALDSTALISAYKDKFKMKSSGLESNLVKQDAGGTIPVVGTSTEAPGNTPPNVAPPTRTNTPPQAPSGAQVGPANAAGTVQGSTVKRGAPDIHIVPVEIDKTHSGYEYVCLNGKEFPFALVGNGVDNNVLYILKGHDLFRRAAAMVVHEYINGIAMLDQIIDVAREVHTKHTILVSADYLSQRLRDRSLEEPSLQQLYMSNLGLASFETNLKHGISGKLKLLRKDSLK